MKIGVLGTGQLCWMMATAAQSLDVDVVAVGKPVNPLLEGLCETQYIDFSDTANIVAALEQVDVITFETESIAENIVEAISNNSELAKKCRPNLTVLRKFQHRFQEKNYFSALNLPTVPYALINEQADVEKAANTLSFPLILKTCFGGYDGKGQAVVNSTEELLTAWQAVDESMCIAEQFLKFEKEVSVIGARDTHGNIVFYPLITNYHRSGILRMSLVDEASELQQSAENIMTSIMEDLDYIGCMTLEFFVHDNKLVLNEVAPRVHNSGHWTIDACDTSQFALHLKAISGAKLKSPQCTLPAAMFNCIGEISCVPAQKVKLYDYAKEARANRKLGHVNFNAADFSSDLHAVIVSYMDNGDDAEFWRQFETI